MSRGRDDRRSRSPAPRKRAASGSRDRWETFNLLINPNYFPSFNFVKMFSNAIYRSPEPRKALDKESARK